MESIFSFSTIPVSVEKEKLKTCSIVLITAELSYGTKMGVL